MLLLLLLPAPLTVPGAPVYPSAAAAATHQTAPAVLLPPPLLLLLLLLLLLCWACCCCCHPALGSRSSVPTLTATLWSCCYCGCFCNCFCGLLQSVLLPLQCQQKKGLLDLDHDPLET
jgi:hypothetical protein